MEKAKDLMKKDFIAVNADEKITKLIGLLKTSKEKAAIVLNRKGEFAGITAKKFMYRVNVDTSQAKVATITMTCATLKESDSLETVAGLMYTSDLRMLPVLKEKKVIGVVLAQDIIKAMQKLPFAQNLTAMDAATKKLITLSLNADLGKALNVMRTNRINRVPIVDENNELQGIISFRELMKGHLSFPTQKEQSAKHGVERQKAGVETEKPNYLKIQVKDEMIEEVKTAWPETKLSRIAEMITKTKGSQVVIVERNKPVGIITPRDLLKTFLLQRVQLRNIQFKGLPELDEIDKSIVEKAVTESYDKIEKIVNNIIYLTVHIRKYRTTGLRKRYEIKAKLYSPGLRFNANKKVIGWNLLSMIQEAMANLERLIIEKAKKRIP